MIELPAKDRRIVDEDYNNNSNNDDVWQNDDQQQNVDDTLNIANHDWNRLQESIKSASFHDGFDGEMHNASQNGFDNAWSLIFKPAFIFGELNAILSIISKIQPEKASFHMERLRKLNNTLMKTFKENSDLKEMPAHLNEEFECIQKDIFSIRYS